jgi:cleavage and polyadenylation specificity factor subunit 4
MGPQVMSHGGGPNGSGPPRRNLDEVLCFKVCFVRLFFDENTHILQCGEKGHYANHCRNRNVPGNRGGLDRARRYGATED